MKRLLVCWTGFGQPRAQEKLEWLQENMSILQRSKGATMELTFRLFCYEDPGDPEFSVTFPSELQVQYGPGIVYQFLRRGCKPDYVQENFDYILCILDDVCLDPEFSLEEFVSVYERNKLDLLACSLSEKSPEPIWDHMRARKGNPVGRKTNMAEYFVFLMDGIAYRTFYQIFLHEQTKWGWGIDFCLESIAGFQVGVMDRWPVHHRICGDVYARKENAALEAQNEFARWMIKNGTPGSGPPEYAERGSLE